MTAPLMVRVAPQGVTARQHPTQAGSDRPERERGADIHDQAESPTTAGKGGGGASGDRSRRERELHKMLCFV